MRDGSDGAEARLAAAQDLKRRLELILEGEAPYDIFVRWKPLAEQPIGWNPDLNDGVRLNIRPFMTAEVLRHNKKPKLNIDVEKGSRQGRRKRPLVPGVPGRAHQRPSSDAGREACRTGGVMQLTGLKIEHYRGIKSLELTLDTTTVLIGENNCGKTTVLHALRACLHTLRSAGRAAPFDEFDLHFDSRSADPTTAPPIVITLTFEEKTAGEWSEEVEQRLGGDGGVIALIPPDDRSRVQLRVTAEYSKVTQDIETTFEFLDAAGRPLPAKNRSRLSNLQQLRPLFYLSALRDAGKEFSRTSQFWSPFVKHSQIDETTKAAIEAQLENINAQIIEAHGTFKGVREHLGKVQELVALGEQDVISVDAVPARVFDMLNRTQVSIASATGARLPIGRHGEGTQSLTVLMLFDAFLKSELARKQGVKESKPIVALEEPEAHLHPNAVRALWKTIQDIDGQKLVATHSGDLLSEVDVYSIRRLYRKMEPFRSDRLQRICLMTGSSRNSITFVRRTRGELFFARVLDSS
ncbi:MAG: YjbD family protein [Chromatiales bacterium]|nr:YjbD family protein [Chromatiales bacterium]